MAAPDRVRTRRIGLLLVALIGWVCVSFHTPLNVGAATLVWQTTFNCPTDWNQSMGLAEALVCAANDGIAGSGAWTSSGHPLGDEITLAANNPGGGGGRGFRHWRCDGQNCNGGGLAISFSATPASEFWLRWYMRYQAGFVYSPLNYTKEVYLEPGGARAAEVGFHGADRFGPYVENPGRYVDGNRGWQSTMGGIGDGNWHCYEIHVKYGAGNGVSEQWIDSVKLGPGYFDVNWGSPGGWSWFELGSNSASPANGGDRYVDYDDVAVSVTGQVGCAASGGTAPRAPLNLRIVR